MGPFELAIIGGGPAGVAAGVYAARKKIQTVFLTYSFENQSAVSENIQNWIGTTSISGADFAKALEAHLRAYAGSDVAIKTGEKISNIKKDGENFVITSENGEQFTSKTVLIATGSVRRKLEIPGAKEFEHKGLTYCASCDGPLFADQDVVVVGGGNAAFETVAQLAAYCKSVTLINRGDTFRADPVTVEKVCSRPNVKAIIGAIPTEVKGDKFVTGFVYTKNGEKIEIPVTGIFVEIGLIPNTSFAKDVVPMNEMGQIFVDPKTQQTKTAGIWAAGDCTDGLYHQNNIAAGDAVKALEDIYLHLHAK